MHCGFVLALMLAGLAVGDALKCYSCQWGKKKDGNIFSKIGEGIKDIAILDSDKCVDSFGLDPEKDTKFIFGCTGSCSKTKVVDAEGMTRYTRTCAIIASKEDKCSDTEAADGTKTTVCYCNSQHCNGGESVRAQISVFLTAIGLMYIYFS